MSEEFVTTGEAAKLLGVRSVNTVKRMIREGRLSATQPGAHYRIRRDDVDRIAAGRPTGSSPPDTLKIPEEAIAAWAGRHRVKSIALFGSAARGDMRPDSDVDIAIELLPSVRVGLIGLGGMQSELEELFGRAVDLGTWDSFRPRVRREAQRDARLIYEG